MELIERQLLTAVASRPIELVDFPTGTPVNREFQGPTITQVLAIRCLVGRPLGRDAGAGRCRRLTMSRRRETLVWLEYGAAFWYTSGLSDYPGRPIASPMPLQSEGRSGPNTVAL